MQDDARKIVREAASEEDGRLKLSCARAFRLAAEHRIPLAEIGRICDEEGIRLCRCQLGCFP